MTTAIVCNISRAFGLFTGYEAEVMAQIEEDEDSIDKIADHIGKYPVQISTTMTSDYHVEIMNYYFSAIIEFERLGSMVSDVCSKMGDGNHCECSAKTQTPYSQLCF